jgi:hypothetical protein
MANPPGNLLRVLIDASLKAYFYKDQTLSLEDILTQADERLQEYNISAEALIRQIIQAFQSLVKENPEDEIDFISSRISAESYIKDLILIKWREEKYKLIRLKLKERVWDDTIEGNIRWTVNLQSYSKNHESPGKPICSISLPLKDQVLEFRSTQENLKFLIEQLEQARAVLES